MIMLGPGCHRVCAVFNKVYVNWKVINTPIIRSVSCFKKKVPILSPCSNWPRPSVPLSCSLEFFCASGGNCELLQIIWMIWIIGPVYLWRMSNATRSSSLGWQRLNKRHFRNKGRLSSGRRAIAQLIEWEVQAYHRVSRLTAADPHLCSFCRRTT